MILTGEKIISGYRNKNITISPFSIESVSTNSYDLSFGSKYIIYTDPILDPRKENKYQELFIPDDGLLLNKGDFVLGESVEVIGSNKFVPIIHGKSGVARKGLFVHVTADLFDLGYFGKATFQLYATQRIRLYCNSKIAQVSFWRTTGKITLYSGKYQNGTGPQASQIHKSLY